MQTFFTYEKNEKGEIFYTGKREHWEHYTVWLAWCGVNADTARVRNEIAVNMPTPSITWYSPDGAVKNERFGIYIEN